MKDYGKVKQVDFMENETMEMLGKQKCILPDSQESGAIKDVLKAYGIYDKKVVILSDSDIISLCNNIYILGAKLKRGNNGRFKGRYNYNKR